MPEAGKTFDELARIARDTQIDGLPSVGQRVAGYVQQSDDAVALVNHFKEVEERLLRDMDVMADSQEPHRFDGRWLAVARTQLQQGFMALNRAVFQPRRIRLPGDEKPE